MFQHRWKAIFRHKDDDNYFKSLEIREKLFGPNHKTTASSYNNLALFYHNIKKNEEKAEYFYIKSLNIRVNQLGFHSQTAQSYRNIGFFYQNMKKDYYQAEKNYVKSLEILEKTFGKNHKQTIQLYKIMFDLYEYCIKDHKKALKFKTN